MTLTWLSWLGTGSNSGPDVVSLTGFTDTLNNRQLRKYGPVHETKLCALYTENSGYRTPLLATFRSPRGFT